MKRSRISVLVLALSLFTAAASAGPLAPAAEASSLKICGTVSLYVQATALTQGALTIGGIPYVISAGATLSSLVNVGANLCFDLNLDLSGGISGAVVSANTTATINICGKVTAYAAATASGVGTLTVAGRTFVLGVGATLPASVKVGADLCLDLTLDAFGQVQDGSVTANVTSTVKICGQVTALARATLTSTGVLTIAGRSFVLALGSQVPASLSVGTDLCATLTLNAFGQVQDGSITANVTSTLDVCGQVTILVDATLTHDGTMTVGGVPRTIAAGTDVDAAVTVGAYVHLRLTIDVFGRIARVTTLGVGASLSAVCGGAAPVPSGTPAPTAVPTGSQAPTASATPSGTPVATASTTPSADTSPSGSPAPAGAVDSATCGSAGGSTGTAGGDTTGIVVPDTDSLQRTARVVVANGLPLAVIAALGLLASWFAARRRRERHAQALALPGDGDIAAGES